MCSAGTSFPWSFSLPDFPISLSKSVAFRTALLWNSGHQFPWQLWLQAGMPELELPPGFQKPFPKGGESALSQHDPSGLKQPRLPGVRNESFILVGSIFPPGIALPVFQLFPGHSTACSSRFCGILGIVLPASFPPPPEGAKLGSSNPLWEQRWKNPKLWSQPRCHGRELLDSISTAGWGHSWFSCLLQLGFQQGQGSSP